MDDPQVPRREDVTAYIGELAGELADMAKAARCNYLAYLLELAKIEAAELPPEGIIESYAPPSDVEDGFKH